jgi:hypothetical protein
MRLVERETAKAFELPFLNNGCFNKFSSFGQDINEDI